MTAIPATEGPSAGQVGPPPPFDAELRPALDAMAAGGRPEFTLADIPLIRRAPAAFLPPTDEDLRRGGAFEVSTAAAPGPAGAPDVPLLICRPAGVTAPVACIYYIHGGGMIIGDHRATCPRRPARPRRALGAGGRVGGVPARAGDAAPRAGRGLLRRPASGPRRTPPSSASTRTAIVVGGGSAGGGLAAAVALLARDRGGPALAGQLLICPMLDDRNDTPSVAADGRPAASGTARPTRSAGRRCSATPAAAPTSRRTPRPPGPPTCPACRPPSSTWARRRPSGTRTSPTRPGSGRRAASAELHVWPGGFHGFAGMVPGAALSRAAVAAQRTWLRRLLS